MYAPDIGSAPLPDGLVGAAFLPPGDDPVPGVIHLHGHGGAPFVGLARLLASRGFAALALQYFGDPDPLSDTLRAVPVEYVTRAVEWLGSHERVVEGVGLFGFSRGGTLALLAASRTDAVGAVAGWATSGGVYEGFGPDRTPAGTAAWSVDDRPVSFLELADADPGPPPAPGLPLFEPPLDAAPRERLAAATVPVEAADAPIYLVSAADDRRWPSTRLSARVVDRLAGAGYLHPYAHDAFEDAGHYMRPPYLPTAGTTRDRTDVYGGSPAANARANETAWRRTRAFLSRALQTAP
ncbi:acyl-CoA thioester hydrolase/BAAT C-terminal domain-containing protein [Haloarcula brevis]|uniref:acyl-CoA thioester hydrolase/BAAT C-terminal domain-containing protein n=1 Tax=Haloarcula brevis TaxID=3111453 RepID=UPI00300F4FD0